MSDRNYLSDVRVVTDITLAITLVYVGCDLYSITKTSGGRFEFKIVVPALDFEEYKKEFSEGRLAIADARAFGRTHSEVMRLIKEVHLKGQWTNEDLARYAKETGFEVA